MGGVDLAWLELATRSSQIGPLSMPSTNCAEDEGDASGGKRGRVGRSASARPPRARGARIANAPVRERGRRAEAHELSLRDRDPEASSAGQEHEDGEDRASRTHRRGRGVARRRSAGREGGESATVRKSGSQRKIKMEPLDVPTSTAPRTSRRAPVARHARASAVRDDRGHPQRPPGAPPFPTPPPRSLDTPPAPLASPRP